MRSLFYAGLKEKYEVHHGVRITDSAIVAAVNCHRYITSRFLPDKAIDLMDEAASKLEHRSGSVPEDIDEIERKLMQLQIEKEALKKRKTMAARDRVNAVDKEIPSCRAKNQLLQRNGILKKAEIRPN